jgi:hypothetical protein
MAEEDKLLEERPQVYDVRGSIERGAFLLEQVIEVSLLAFWCW